MNFKEIKDCIIFYLVRIALCSVSLYILGAMFLILWLMGLI